MTDLINELSDNQKEKLLDTPVLIELFDTKYPNDFQRIVDTLERKRKIALRDPKGIKGIFFEKYIDAFIELVSDRLLKRYFASIFTIDIIVPNEELTKEMLNMCVKYKSPMGELEHPSQLC